MSDSSEESDANIDGFDFNPNKRQSEKKRREQENLYLEELSQLISANFPELSDSDDSSLLGDPSKTEKGSILRETVEKLKKIRDERRNDGDGLEFAGEGVLPKEILGSLVLEALDGFIFVVSREGRIDFASENLTDYLGFQPEALTERSIYNFIHKGDHARFSVNLMPDTWKSWRRHSSPPFASPYELKNLDRSHVFNVRFLKNSIKTEPQEGGGLGGVDHMFENMQVSAIVMLNQESGDLAKSGLFCMARKLAPNEIDNITPVQQFTTQIDYESSIITTVDTSGLPDPYVEVIGRYCINKKLEDLVHQQDAPLLAAHLETLEREGAHISRVYRLVLPAPHHTVHVMTKSRIFRPNPNLDFKGYTMSTHTIVRDCELKLEDRADLRSEVRNLPQESQIAVLPQGASPGVFVYKSSMPTNLGIQLGPNDMITSVLDSLLPKFPFTQPNSSDRQPARLQLNMPGNSQAQLLPQQPGNSSTGAPSPSAIAMLVSPPPPIGSSGPSSQASLQSLSAPQSSASSLLRGPQTMMCAGGLPSPTAVSSSSPVLQQQSGPRFVPLTPVSSSSTGNAVSRLPTAGRIPTLSPSRIAACSPSPTIRSPQPRPPTSNTLAYLTGASPTSSSPSFLSSSSQLRLTAATAATGVDLPFMANTTTARAATPQQASPSSSSSSSVEQGPRFPSYRGGILCNLLSPNPDNRSLAARSSLSSPPVSRSNELLKGLLTSREQDGNRAQQARNTSLQADNISLIQLLNGKTGGDRGMSSQHSEPSELLRRLRQPTIADSPASREKLSELSKLLESPSSSSLAGGVLKRHSSLDEGPPQKISNTAVPALENLLRKETKSVPPPPPLPRKWTEIPGDRLPRDQIVSKIREHQNRNNNSGSTGIIRRSDGSFKPTGTGGGLDLDIGDVADWPAELMDTLTSASLQELLDTVLTSGCDLDVSALQDQDQAQISAIEQQLQLVERSILPPATSATITTAAPLSGGVIRSGAATIPTTGPHHRILQQRVSLPVASPSIEDMMKGVPPNVTVKPMSEPAGGRGHARHLSGGLEQHKASFGRTMGRHASGDLAGPSATATTASTCGGGELSVGGGRGAAYRPASRHASGDTFLQVTSLNPPLRRASGDLTYQHSYSTVNLGAASPTLRSVLSGRNSGGAPANASRGMLPTGRALSQEDLEGLGLSVELQQQQPAYTPTSRFNLTSAQHQLQQQFSKQQQIQPQQQQQMQPQHQMQPQQQVQSQQQVQPQQQMQLQLHSQQQILPQQQMRPQQQLQSQQIQLRQQQPQQQLMQRQQMQQQLQQQQPQQQHLQLQQQQLQKQQQLTQQQQLQQQQQLALVVGSGENSRPGANSHRRQFSPGVPTSQQQLLGGPVGDVATFVRQQQQLPGQLPGPALRHQQSAGTQQQQHQHHLQQQQLKQGGGYFGPGPPFPNHQQQQLVVGSGAARLETSPAATANNPSGLSQLSGNIAATAAVAERLSVGGGGSVYLRGTPPPLTSNSGGGGSFNGSLTPQFSATAAVRGAFSPPLGSGSGRTPGLVEEFTTSVTPDTVTGLTGGVRFSLGSKPVKPS